MPAPAGTDGLNEMTELTSDEICARNILRIFEAEKTGPDEMMIIGAVAIKYRERFSGVR